mgnify:FL=1
MDNVEIIESEQQIVEHSKKQIEVAREIIPMDKLMEMSETLAKSTIVPAVYQRRPENCFVALDMASRMGLSPMVVMQNLYVIQGKPSWSGSAMASLIRSSNQFTNVELNFVGQEGSDSWGAYVTATRVSNGKLLKGSTVTIAMAKKEGWYQKGGSKWQTIPELMLSYRAYAFFGRVYAPELLMGLQSAEEVEDVIVKSTVTNPYAK